MSDKSISKEAIVAASAADVWEAWTTSEGCRSFFAPEAWVELKEGGAFEIYFNGAAPRGKQGSEKCRVIEFTPEQHLAFTWNAPPEFPNVREQYTRVDVRLEPQDEGRTKVTLDHTGWREGEEWDQVFGYFQPAWGYVMRNLTTRFEHGPIDWSADDDEGEG